MEPPVDEQGDEIATVMVSEAPIEQRGDVALVPGMQLGRYVVLEYIGRGANGEVYSAFDPELDRRVAIKLLRRQSVRGGRALVREARAMAKLTHPNVVAVHDVGTVVLPDHELPRVFIAMEYVPGGTLREWWRLEPRSWAEHLAMFIQAGRGLAAAHAQGLVHRDFKPDNVLVGEDGRLRVTDFGLARSAHELCVAADAGSTTREEIGDVTEPEGKVVLPPSRWRGTPAYMAPEQFQGGTVDPLTDQFGYCVCFFEALYGARPFPGVTAMEIAEHVCAGEMIAPLEDVEVPRRIVEVVLRGLSTERERRFPDMYALLEALDPPPRRKWPWAALAGGLIVGALALAFTYEAPKPDPCADAGEEIAQMWSAQRRGEVEEAILATEAPGAADTAARVLQTFDVYAGDWQQARQRSCRAQGTEGEARELHERRTRCLDLRFDAFAARLDALRELDSEQVGQLVATASTMPKIEECSDLDYLAMVVLPGADIETDVRSFERRLERIEALRVLGAYGRAQSLLDPVVAPISALDHPPLSAKLELLQGQLAAQQHHDERAELHLRQAYFAALAAGEELDAVSAAAMLTQILGADLGRFDEARDWAEHGLAVATRIGQPEAIAELVSSEGIAEYRSGRLELALERLTRAHALYIEAYDSEDIHVGKAATNVAAILLALHRYEESLPYHREATLIIEAKLGPMHVDNITTHLNYALTLMNLEREAEARRELELAWEILEVRAQEGDAFVRALIHNAMGDLDGRAGEWQRAAEHYGAMLEIMRGLFGEQNSYVANAQTAHAGALIRLGRHAEALPELEQAVAQLEQAEVPVEELAYARAELGIALSLEGRELERARVLVRRALATFAEAKLTMPKSTERWLTEHPELLADG
jgi:tetratricopeptide (TPR) repeat protein/tRNA A-37 threonylcarbamoyl transferase component Bud32